MPTTIKNEKGLFLSSKLVGIDASMFESIASVLSSDPEGIQWIQTVRALTRIEQSYNSNHKGISHKYPYNHFLYFSELPSGFGNETQLWESSSAKIRSNWNQLVELISQWSQLSKKISPLTHKDQLKYFKTAFPSSKTIQKALTYHFTDLTPGWEAQGGDAWAIWMGSAREQGYMDDKKRPAGAASARLFESPSAAARTARLAKFGGDRGPAAIVRLHVECLDITSSDPGASCEAPRMIMAQREAHELMEAIEDASIDQIRRALGEPTNQAQNVLTTPPESSLAGCEEGFACWVERDVGHCHSSGFVNIRYELGPLTSAVLKKKAADARKNYWQGHTSIIKVGCRPIAIEELIGEPNVNSVESAIAWETEQAAINNLRKQDAQTLRDRAKALESGEATPRKRTRSL